MATHMRIHHNQSLKPYNTFGIEVKAETLVSTQVAEEVPGFFDRFGQPPALVLGGGSNVLITSDISGVVMKMEIPGIRVIDETDTYLLVEAGAGVVWHEFVMHCIEQNWAGVENLSLIPGSVGAAPMQNIGAYGVELESVFEKLEAYHWPEKRFVTFRKEECEFGYRDSIFKRQLKGEAIITSVTFRLSKVPKYNIGYGTLQQQLEMMGVKELTLRAVSEAVMAIRRSKLPDPSKLGNSGSFFKNPVVDKATFEQLLQKYPDAVGYPVADGVKVAAGWLIEKAGLKGKRFGNCGVHDRQALVLVNYGGATGAEIYRLSETVINRVYEQFGITLEREVNVI
ncbi:MAG: UDP-N-acetylmuramate dehydrogenase [Salibacteraceae bacterium]